MESASSSERLVPVYQTKQHYIQRDSNLNCHHQKNFKYHFINMKLHCNLELLSSELMTDKDATYLR
jgi:hypothetical protein